MEMTLGPRNLGDIIRDTFRIYGKNIWRFAAIIAVVAIPLSIVAGLVFLAIIFINPPAPDVGFEEFIMQHLPALIPAFIIIIFISIAAESLAQGAMVYCTGEQYFHHPINNGYAYKFSWKRLPNMLGAVLLIFLTTIAIIFILLGIPIASFFHLLPGMNPQLIIWVISLGLVSLAAFTYITIIWQFALQTALLEGCGPVIALSRSYQLVKGNWWRVFGIIFVLWLMVFGIDLVLEFVPLIGRFASAVFTPPITFIGTALLYFDLRVRKQGYNLDALASELGLAKTATDAVPSPPE